jgi:hypothetical protein
VGASTHSDDHVVLLLLASNSFNNCLLHVCPLQNVLVCAEAVEAYSRCANQALAEAMARSQQRLQAA